MMLLPRVVHLPINSLNNHHYVKNVFLRSSVTIAGFVTKNERGEVAKESLINSSILTRYFPSATEVTHELSANQLSRAVIDGMIKDAVSSNDTVTLDVIIRSGVEIENIDKLVLESAADCYLRNKKYRNAFQLFHMCNPYSGAFSNKLCMKLLQDLINHYQWESAFRATVYMILHQYRIPPESVFFTISGLIEKPNGTVKVLELIKLIVSSRRMDLADHFNLSKITKYSKQSPEKSDDQAIRQELQHCIDVCCEALSSSGWISFSIAKLLVSLTVSTNNQELGEAFIRRAVAECTSPVHDNNHELDLLSMLRAFSQGISLSSRMSYFEYSTKKIVTTTAGKVQMNLVLLDLLCGNIDNLRVNVPLRVNDFLSTYWVLSFQNLTGNFEVTEDIFPSEKYVYNTLANFISDSAASIEIRPSSPSQRRLYRILADRLGLNHQLKFLVNKDNKLELNLIVTKDVMQCSEPALSSLNFIKECDFRQDINFRQIDGEPYRWADVKKEISKQDDAIIYIVSQKFAKAMSGYPSISWLLLWVEIHRERGIPLPEGFLRAAVQMCSARNDIYGLLEVLYLNYEEQFLITHDTRQRQILAHVLEVNYCEGELFTEADSAIDNLSKSDWNKAFSTALRSVTDNVNSASHRQGFIEMLSMMRQMQLELDNECAQKLIRYLILTKQEPETLWRLLARLRKSSDMPLSKKECISISEILLARVPFKRRMISIVKPSTNSESYIRASHSSIQKLTRNFLNNSYAFDDASFLQQLEHNIWNSQDENSRRTLLSLSRNLIRKDGTFFAEGKAKSSEQLQQLTELAILYNTYVAFLVSYHDGNYRDAFDLLYDTELFLKDFEKLASSYSENQFSHDAV